MMDQTSSLEKQVRTLRKRSLFTLFLTWLALFFTVIGIAAGYKNFLRVHDKANEARDDAKVAMALMPQMASKTAIERWQGEVRSQLVTNQAQASKELSELRVLRNSNTYVESTLRQQVEQLTQQQKLLNNIDSNGAGKPPHLWQVAEVRFLLKMATRHLAINQDTKTAIAAMRSADRELIALGQPELLPIRGLIAKDIAKLQDYRAVDLTTVIVAIDALANQLESKANQERVVDVKADDGAVTANDSASKADSILQRMKARLDEAVVIKRYDNKLAKQIKGDTQGIRFELIRLKLETLKLLALKSQHTAYREQLKQLGNLLNTEHAEWVDSRILAALTKLESIEFDPQLPSLLAGPLLDELLAGAANKGQH